MGLELGQIIAYIKSMVIHGLGPECFETLGLECFETLGLELSESAAFAFPIRERG